MLRIAEKAFRPGKFPFPLMHIDTGHNYKEVIDYRDKRAAELGERLIVRSVEDSMARGTVVASFPIGIKMLERHPLGSQVFFPCSGSPFIAVVATNGQDDKPDEASIRAFYVRPNQGVNYRMGTWHHPLICLVPDSDFIIADRIGPGNNCDEEPLSREYKIAAPTSDALSVKK